ncbi:MULTISPECIES: DUF3267 domain-containing protein [unclassified Bacillus (in: firmicutes)]|uniref:DUF3267 domain-containing protein n=1 Tax=unclassified Bacillus (in: firmicutes) TaxID=185979 RepID=UPI00300FA716
MNWEPINLNNLSKDDATITVEKANKIMIFFSIIITLFVFFLYRFIWGVSTWENSMQFVLVCLTSFVSIIIHELLHAIGFNFFGKVNWSDIKFGIVWKSLTPYAHCKKAIGINAYRISILMPIVILGILPTFIGLLIGNGFITILGTFMILGGLGDVLIFYLIYSYDANSIVKDHSEKIGCEVFYKENIN